jgi:hypothetical protein
MVDFNKWRCRNCKHWHVLDFLTTRDLIKRDCIHSNCGCSNWESNDNLVYLERKYASR